MIMEPWINITVSRCAVREIVVMAHIQVVRACGDAGEPDTIRAEGARDAVIDALAAMLGDSSGARSAIAGYLHGNLGSGEYGIGEMTDHIMRLGDLS